MFDISVMQEDGLHYLFEWAVLEQWRSEPLHIACLFRTQREGFFIAYVDGKPAGMVLAVKQGEHFGIISNLVVLKAFRSRGLGKRLFEQALEYLAGRQIFLDSIITKQEMYKRAGFRRVHDVGCYAFKVGTVTLPESDIETVEHVDTKRLLAFDAEAAGFDRSDYLRCILSSEQIHLRAVDAGQTLSSYALCFAYADGYKIILASRDINEALTLFFALIVNIRPHTPIYLNATDSEPLTLAIVTLLKMERVSHTIRMTRSA